MNLRRMLQTSSCTSVLAICLLFPRGGLAAHPLVTDDVGTQGKGGAQLEFDGEYGYEREGQQKTNSFTMPTMPVISYGLADAIDLVLGASYTWNRTSGPEGTVTERGITDTAIDLKWRFWQKEGLAFAVKPGMTIPTGDDSKGLGAGRVTSHLDFIASKEVGPWAFHLNLGYLRNYNSVDEHKDLWRISSASELSLSRHLRAVGEVGVYRDPDRSSTSNHGFVTGGLIYGISEKLDLDVGVRMGIRKHGDEFAVPAGITWRF